MQGYIDDTCKISGVPIYGNNLNKDIFIDTYSKESGLKYDSYKAKKGKLTIKYKFWNKHNFGETASQDPLYSPESVIRAQRKTLQITGFEGFF